MQIEARTQDPRKKHIPDTMSHHQLAQKLVMFENGPKIYINLSNNFHKKDHMTLKHVTRDQWQQ